MPPEIIPITDIHRPWVRKVLTENWASTRVVARGRIHEAGGLPGFIAVLDGEPAGLLTYSIDGSECEIVSLNSLREGRGIGAALLKAVISAARASGCRRLWLVTTNDNSHALRFYQRQGFVLKALYPGVLAESRRLKPEIPLTGADGIPLRDEIELEFPPGE